MSSTTKYNRQYPTHNKVSHGVLLAHDGIKIAQRYMGKILALDISPSKKIEAAIMINNCIAEMYTVNKWIDISPVRLRVNAFMWVNEFSPEELLKLVCSFIEDILFQSDDYQGFGNYKWLTTGYKLFCSDYVDIFSAEAQAHQNDSRYQSQEYHRTYN